MAGCPLFSRVRAYPFLGAQSVFGIPVTSPADAIPSEWAISTGTRREQACRALQARTLDLCYALEIVFQPSVANLELLLVAVQMLICNLLFRLFSPDLKLTLSLLA
jgi:hypothetical protein